MNFKNPNQQKSIFLQGEGDSWYGRNKSRLNKNHLSHFFSSVESYLNKSSKVLEIGCSSGENLHFLSEKIGCEVYGVDPSAVAVDEGNAFFKDNYKGKLTVGTADSFSFDIKFDFIFFGFCLYLCDRADLAKIVYNCDRHLNSPGYLGIVDFDPPVPVKNSYTHAKDVFSYKMNYSNLFLSHPSYELIFKNSFSHSGCHFDEAENERVGSWLMYKNVDKGYYFLES